MHLLETLGATAVVFVVALGAAEACSLVVLLLLHTLGTLSSRAVGCLVPDRCSQCLDRLGDCTFVVAMVLTQVFDVAVSFDLSAASLGGTRSSMTDLISPFTAVLWAAGLLAIIASVVSGIVDDLASRDSLNEAVGEAGASPVISSLLHRGRPELAS
jgi:hypothetical protein